MPKSAFTEIISAAIIILAIFGILYMFTDWVLGIAIISFCGLLIFINAFIQKHRG